MTPQPLFDCLTKCPGEYDDRPRMDQLLACLAAPQEHAAAGRYLDQRPELAASLRDIVWQLAAESRDRIAKEAYYLYLERKRSGRWPVEGRDWEDWFAAEQALAEGKPPRPVASAG